MLLGLGALNQQTSVGVVDNDIDAVDDLESCIIEARVLSLLLMTHEIDG